MSSFQRRHFVAIAKIIKDHNSPGLPEAFADYFATGKPLFDRRRVLEACGNRPLTQAERAAIVRKIEEE